MVLVGGTALLDWLRLDDVVGAVPVHAFCGAWGTLAAGLFRTGDLFNPTQVMVQFVGVAAGFLWAFPLALLMYYAIDKAIGLRAGTLDEQRGLDFSEHSEIGYPEFQTAVIHERRS